MVNYETVQGQNGRSWNLRPVLTPSYCCSFLRRPFHAQYYFIKSHQDFRSGVDYLMDCMWKPSGERISPLRRELMLIWPLIFVVMEQQMYRGEWGKMPRRVRCPTPSPGETGCHTWMHVFFMWSFSPARITHKNSLLSRFLLRSDRRFFYSLGFLRWIDLNDMWLFNKISHMSISCYFIWYNFQYGRYILLLSNIYCEYFLGYANETSRRHLRERCPVVWWGKTPLGRIFDFSVSEYRGGVFPQQSVAAKE